MRRDPRFSTPALEPNALTGRTVVITGASDGIGRALAERCARAGARVVMVGRNEAKTRHAASEIRSRTGSDQVAVEIADLLHLDEQRALAERLARAYPRLDALVNNAGALFLEHARTRDGIERTVALNHLAYVHLAVRLLPALLAAAGPDAPARLVNVASRAHRRGTIAPLALDGTGQWSGWRAYAASKLGNVLFTRALAARVDARCLCVHAVHPGLVASRFAVNNGRAGRLTRRVMDWFSVSSVAGSDTAAWLLASPEAARSTGDYWVQRARTEPARLARDPALADAVWHDALARCGLEEPVAGCRR